MRLSSTATAAFFFAMFVSAIDAKAQYGHAGTINYAVANQAKLTGTFEWQAGQTGDDQQYVTIEYLRVLSDNTRVHVRDANNVTTTVNKPAKKCDFSDNGSTTTTSGLKYVAVVQLHGVKQGAVVSSVLDTLEVSWTAP